MKKLLLIILSTVFSLNLLAFSADTFDEFTNNITGVAENIAQDNLDNFAKDLGALLGGGAFHQGKVLGMPGFDIGIHIPAKQVNSDNKIVKDADIDTIFFPIIQAEVGLPKKLDFIGRYMGNSEFKMIGFGLRYGILKGSLPVYPNVSVQVVYNTLDVDTGINKFKANTISVAGIVSTDFPIINPYGSIGFDSTTIEPDSSIPLPKSGMKGEATGVRLEAGVNMSLVPFTYLQLGASLINSDLGYTLGLGIKF